MAAGRKTAGFIAGVVVSVSAGTALSVLNPILPKEDKTVISEAPEAQAPAVDIMEAMPAVEVAETATSQAEAPSEISLEDTADDVPEPVSDSGVTPQTAPVVEMEMVPESEDSQELVLVVDAPEVVASVAEPEPNLSEPDNAPEVSNDPAEPIQTEVTSEEVETEVSVNASETSEPEEKTASQEVDSNIAPAAPEKTTEVMEPKADAAEMVHDQAIVKNAIAFESTDKPLLSLVLMDGDGMEKQLPSLQSLGLPISIAIAADDAQATSKATAYKDAGFEVLAMVSEDETTSLSGNQPTEEVAKELKQIFGLLPNAVGLIDRPTGMLQRDQGLARAVVDYFTETGHGLVTYARGVNGVPRISAKENVASGLVLQILAAEGSEAELAQRYLDRAARDARTKGQGIVLLAPTRANLGALVAWSLSSKANGISFAPVSAVLLKSIKK